MADADVGDLEAMLEAQSFPRMAAERLIACLRAIREQRGAVDLRHLSNLETGEAIDWLERLPGVVRKISAQVMNTSTFDRPVMVIEGHHRRIMQRMGLVPEKADTLRCYNALMPALPAQWTGADMDEHHLLLKKLGQTLCRPSRAACGDCPVAADCETGRRRAA